MASSCWQTYESTLCSFSISLTSLQGSEYLKTPIHITPSRASKSAIRAVEKAGGTVFCKHYNALALRDCVAGRTDRLQAAPTLRRDIRMFSVYELISTDAICAVWYTSWNNRGYLSPQALQKMPNVEERWKKISQELLAFQKQEFDAPKQK